MILGKFMPPHRGHQYLVDFARQYCERVHVLVCTLECEPIDGTLRYRWMQELFPQPNVRLVHITENLPQEPTDHPDFWVIWRRVVEQAVGEPIDWVFASEEYGQKLAETLGARFVPVDIGRELSSVSGSAIRADPMHYFNMLPPCVRPHYVKRVCLFGPESTGKSTLARKLAKAFNTVYVHEYARPLLDRSNGQCMPGDIPRIALGQVAAEDAMALHANRMLFCDTDALLTTIWSRTLFDDCPEWIEELAVQRTYDLYLLLDVDCEWVDDQQRFLSQPEQRSAFFNLCRDVLQSRQRPYVLVAGNWEQRFRAAKEAVENLLATPAGRLSEMG